MIFPEQFRTQFPTRPSKPGDGFGCFVVPAHKAPGRRQLNIIANDGLETGWDHVSISISNARDQTPTWAEMCFVKDLFWTPQECVVQFHPAESNYVNTHPGVLHLWKLTKAEFPTPPIICV